MVPMLKLRMTAMITKGVVWAVWLVWSGLKRALNCVSGISPNRMASIHPAKADSGNSTTYQIHRLSRMYIQCPPTEPVSNASQQKTSFDLRVDFEVWVIGLQFNLCEQELTDIIAGYRIVCL